MVRGSGSGKTNALLNLVNLFKIFLYVKDPYEAKHQFLINKREGTDLKYWNDSKDFIEHSSNIDDIYKNMEVYNPDKKRTFFIFIYIYFFDDTIADMHNNEKLNIIIKKLFIRETKLNISLIFITQSHFKVPKDVRLKTTHFCIFANSKQTRT